MTYPDRIPLAYKTLEFKELLELQFMPPRYDDFPALKLAFEVGRQGGFKPAVFNAANETAVYAFLEDKISFPQIYQTVTSVLDAMESEDDFTLDNLLAIDQWARCKASELIK